MELSDFIAKMPKAELICTLRELLSHHLFAHLFLAVYYPNMSVLLIPEEFFNLARAYLCKYKEENIVHTECFFDPQAHTSRGILSQQ